MTSPKTSPTFDAVVLSGGGAKGLAELGALRYHHEKGTLDLSKVKVFIGTSIGSVINLLMICGYTPTDIFAKMHHTKSLVNVSLSNITQITSTYGLTNLEPIMIMLRDMIVVSKVVDSKLKKIPTLKELFDITDKLFIVSVGNITKSRGEYISYKTNPHLSVVDAVKLSCSLPIIFEKIEYRGNYYTDGGLTDHFPIDHPALVGTKKVLGIMVSSPGGQTTNIITYLSSIISLCMAMTIMPKVNQVLTDPHTNITLIRLGGPGDPSSLLDSGLSSETKMKMFLSGYEEAKIEDLKEVFDMIEIDDEIVERASITSDPKVTTSSCSIIDGWDVDF